MNATMPGTSTQDLASAAEASSQPPAAAANDTLIPTLTLDQLHDSLWQHLGKEDRRALRLLSKAMRQQADECVRWQRIDLPEPGDAPPTRQLELFPRLTTLFICTTDMSRPGACEGRGDATGEDLARLFQAAAMASSQITEVLFSRFFEHLSQATRALSVSMHASLAHVSLCASNLDGPVFEPLATCVTLRSMELRGSKFLTDEAVASLQYLTQVCHLLLSLFGCDSHPFSREFEQM